ncbi:MAG: filamentous hemagglutinin N-terminal domain-containing protein, partial [Rhizobacter sp.]|nr:filamentous hemagglutinin N-terminal domain-containing protein [Rhizobacter sp.]
MKNAASQRFAARPLAIEISRMFRPGVAAATLLAMPFAFAAPQGGAVTAGQAAIAQNGNTTTITQATQRAAIDWRSFNVGSNETVNFVQPNSSSAVLNRVVGNDASAIFGRITANGQVYLINPNGILFGRTAQVDVGALTATTSNISNADFMAGRMSFSQPGRPDARVENQGSITVGEGGFAALVGRGVVNSGVINARLAKVALAGGDAFVLDLYGDKLVNLIVDPAAMNSLADAHGNPLAASVDHSGQIVAEGGRVQLSVATVKQLVDNLINVSGVIRATSFTQSPGQISLLGDANTRVAVSGTLETSGQLGGRIEVTGRDVALQPGAVLAATGGEGSIAVGGDWQGQGALAHAQQVNVSSGALIDASASAQGTGGTVALWSTESTQFAGRIEARGGSVIGDGGRVEVSSKGRLGFMGDVNVFATQGQQGSLLLDPLNLRIGTVTSGDSEISAEQIRFFLTRGASVSLSADQNVVVDAEVNGLVAGGGVRGGGLTLTAGNNLTVNQTIALNDGALNLTATNGTLSSTDNALLFTGSGAVTLRGGAGVDVGRVLTSGAVDVRSASGAVTLRQAAVAAGATAAPVSSLLVQGAGNVTLNGALASGAINVTSSGGGVLLNGAVLQSTGGAVAVQAAQNVSSSGTGVGLVAGGNLSVTAGQAIDLSTALGGGQVQLNAGGAVSVAQAITHASGTAAAGLGVQAGGAVSLAGARTGSGGVSITTTAGNVSSGGALVSTGAVGVTAAGSVGTSGSRISVDAAAANINLAGAQGVNAASLFSTGSVTLAASAGGVDVSQALSGGAGTVSAATTARPSGVAITARDAIVLNGAAVGSAGLTADSSAGAVTVNTGSIFSQGAVSLSGQGTVTLADGVAIDTQGNGSHVTLTSRGAGLTIGTGGVRANGNANLGLAARNDIALNGDLQTQAGSITVVSSNGAVTAQVANSDTPVAGDAVIDAGASTTLSRINVSGAGRVFLGEMRAYRDITVSSSAGNVILRRGLGGTVATTGYANFAQGYQDALRPDVGRLVIDAPAGSVELNGLNLDGNTVPTDTTPGLSITAGRRIVSNEQIAVNKGDVVLAAGTTQATDGVYLGSNVYSRGWDSVGADGLRGTADDRKLAYGIQISGRVLGLFDNNDEFATLPSGTSQVRVNGTTVVRVDREGYLVDLNGQRTTPLQMVSTDVTGVIAPSAGLVVYNVDGTGRIVSSDPAINGDLPTGVRGVAESRDIAKLIISNNTANYQDAGDEALRTRLVPYTSHDTTANNVLIDVQTIAGVGNAPGADGRFSVDSFAPTLVALSQTPVSVLPRANVIASTLGMGFKVLGFEDAADAQPLVWSNGVSLARGADGYFRELQSRSGTAGLSDLPLGTLPVNGAISITAPVGDVHRVHQVELNDGRIVAVTQTELLVSGSATYNFRLEDGANRGFARLESVSLSAGAVLPTAAPSLPPDAVRIVSSGAWVNGGGATLVGSLAEVRLRNPLLLAEPGRAAHVGVRGALFPSTLAGQPAAAVQNGAVTNPSFVEVNEAVFVQAAGGTGASFNASLRPTDFVLSRVTVQTSAQGAFTPTTLGTRVFVYDGLIESLNGASITDGVGGVVIPGMGGITGNNNSSAGFAGVGAGFAPVGGSATPVVDILEGEAKLDAQEANAHVDDLP